MSNTLKSLMVLAATLALPVSAASASDETRPVVAISGVGADAGQAGQLTVDGSAGRYDRLTSTALTLPLVLSAALQANGANVKIVTADLFLKSEGSGKDVHGFSALTGGAPEREINGRQDATFTIPAAGPVAQNAIAACNGLAQSGRGVEHRVTMSLPVLLRVTAGRFNFKWTGYDLVAPSNDIQNNRDFYADLETSEAETAIDVGVICQPVAAANTAAPAHQTAPAAAVKQVTFTPDDTRTVIRSAPDSAPVAMEPAPAAVPRAPVATAAVSTKAQPQCDGGMVRQIGSGDSGYLCLCPGNTKRVETGPNAFACERGKR